MDAWVLKTNESWSEQNLWSLRLVMLRQSDLLSIWKGIIVWILGALHVHESSTGLASQVSVNLPTSSKCSQLVLAKLQASKLVVVLLVMNLNITVKLLNPSDNLMLGSGSESVARSLQQLHEMVSDITASEVDSPRRVSDGEALTDGTGVGASISNIEHDSSGQTPGVEGEHCTGVEEQFWHLIVLEEKLGHANTIANWIVWGLCQQNWMLTGVDLQLGEDVLEDLIHVIPVTHDSPLNGIVQLDQTSVLFL